MFLIFLILFTRDDNFIDTLKYVIKYYKENILINDE